MDLSKMTRVGITNPKGQNFKLKFSEKNASITFSHKLFAELQLEYNSLSQYDNDEKKAVIGICPGDSGDFYKKRVGAKGRSVKSTVLAKVLVANGVKTGRLDLVSLGENDGVHYYEVVQEGKDGEVDQPDWVDETPKAQAGPLSENFESKNEVVNDNFG